MVSAWGSTPRGELCGLLLLTSEAPVTAHQWASQRTPQMLPTTAADSPHLSAGGRKNRWKTLSPPGTVFVNNTAGKCLKRTSGRKSMSSYSDDADGVDIMTCFCNRMLQRDATHAQSGTHEPLLSFILQIKRVKWIKMNAFLFSTHQHIYNTFLKYCVFTVSCTVPSFLWGCLYTNGRYLSFNQCLQCNISCHSSTIHQSLDLTNKITQMADRSQPKQVNFCSLVKTYAFSFL